MLNRHDGFVIREIRMLSTIPLIYINVGKYLVKIFLAVHDMIKQLIIKSEYSSASFKGRPLF